MDEVLNRALKLSVVVRKEVAGVRLNKFIQLPEFRKVLVSRSSTIAALSAGRILLNGEHGVEGSRVLQEGDRVDVYEALSSEKNGWGLDKRFDNDNLKVFWKPPGFPIAPGATMSDADELMDSSDIGTFKLLYRTSRSIGSFLVLLRRNQKEARAMLTRSMRATVRAMVDGAYDDPIALRSRANEEFSIRPVDNIQTTSGAISTIDIECSPFSIISLREALSTLGVHVIRQCDGKRRSPVKGTYLAMISLRIQWKKDATDSSQLLTFESEEPAKFQSLRDREKKFFKSRSQLVRADDEMPMPYVLGVQEFAGLEFKIERMSVIVPRKATETLVDAAVEAVNLIGQQPRSRAVNVLDLGTGCGNILLSVLHRCPNAVGVGVDLSPDAIRIAEENAERLNLLSRTRFDVADFEILNDIERVPQSCRNEFDVIVSNPPYLSELDAEEILYESSKKHEPRIGLITDQDAFLHYKNICRSIAGRLRSGHPLLNRAHGRLILETASGSASKVREHCEEIAGMELERSLRDNYNFERCLVLRYPESST